MMPSKKIAAGKPAVKASARPAVKKPAAKKPTVKRASKKSALSKASGKAAVAKAAAKKPLKAPGQPKKAEDNTKFSVPPRVLLDDKARKKKGESIESLVSERDIQLKSVQEYMGLQQKQDFHNKPIIPGVFDLLIPPGTPRKLIIRLAREYPVQIVRRDDVYVPIGVCDVERDLLAIRGDAKTVKKMEKILLAEIGSFIDGRDSRLHGYSKPVRPGGIGGPAKLKKSRVKVKSRA